MSFQPLLKRFAGCIVEVIVFVYEGIAGVTPDHVGKKIIYADVVKVQVGAEKVGTTHLTPV